MCLALAVPHASGQGPAEDAPDELSDNWTRQKCELYTHIFRDALGLQGHEGLSSDFLTNNQRFIDAGCTGESRLCPISKEELAFADILTLMTMSEGMASTFVPFGCPPVLNVAPDEETQ